MRITVFNTKVNKESGLCELFKEKSFNLETSFDKISDPHSVYEIMKKGFHLDERAEEYVYMLSLNTKARLIGVFEVSHGSHSMSIMPIREILIRALYSNASQLILVHNHPSGDSSPSREDISSTKKLHEATKLVGLSLTDHIIIGDYYTSLKEEALF